MKLMLAQNIRTQRKAHSLTQENLPRRLAQRRAAACKNALAARRLAVYQARRAEWQAGQPLR